MFNKQMKRLLSGALSGAARDRRCSRSFSRRKERKKRDGEGATSKRHWQNT